jgi:integrase/recombinase XerD
MASQVPTLIGQIEEYLAHRYAAGYALQSQSRALRVFGEFCRRKRRAVVTARAAIAWASQGAARLTRIRRLRGIHDFVLYARSVDARHEAPPRDHFGRERPRRRTPYILSKNEVRRLVRGARSLGPAGSSRPRMLEFLFALLACTGLRIGEAISLQYDDVTADGLLVRRDKRGRWRLLPLHATTARALGRFIEWRRGIPADSRNLFVNLAGHPLIHGAVERAFREIILGQGIGRRRGRRRLCVHSLRHTFTVRALERGPSSRDDVGLHMKAVSEYLGHSNIACTYWYYENTPELLRDVMNDCENHVQEIPR